MKKDIQPSAEKWTQSELWSLSLAWLAIGQFIGVAACGLLKPSWKEGYKAAEADFHDWKKEVRETSEGMYKQGKDRVKYDAAQAGAGRYEIDPTSGEVYFKWLKPCDCKEGCKCTK